ncbi:protein translocase subunit SecA-like, partial [Tachysurus ichikawai]
EKVIEGYLPRLTQLAALVVFLLPKSKTNTGCLLEIGTGEGKSCILAMLAVIHAMSGVKVDIVTSSPVLARRDLEEWSKLYKMFDITSSAVPPVLNNVSSEELEELTQEAYKQDVVYSTVGTFAADTLKQEFEKKTTRGDRRFEMVLVDEVDYMTLDNGVQITFLSHESSGLQHLEQVLA